MPALVSPEGLAHFGRLLGQGSREAGGGQGPQISIVGGSGNLGSAVEVGDPAAQGDLARRRGAHGNLLARVYRRVFTSSMPKTVLLNRAQRR